MLQEHATAKGVYRWSHVRNGKVLAEGVDYNTMMVEGLKHLLTVGIADGTKSSTWYVALVNNDNGTKNGGGGDDPPRAPVNTQVYDTFFDTQNTEFTSYDEANRVTYNETMGTGALVTNTANKAVFTISATGAVYGACLVNVNTKDDHGTGVLMSYAAFSQGVLNVYDNDVLNIEIQITLS